MTLLDKALLAFVAGVIVVALARKYLRRRKFRRSCLFCEHLQLKITGRKMSAACQNPESEHYEKHSPEGCRKFKRAKHRRLH